MANAGNAHALQVIVQEGDQSFANDFVFYMNNRTNGEPVSFVPQQRMDADIVPLGLEAERVAG